MNHEPLCNWEWFYHPEGRSIRRCTCDLISRVREDERKKVVEIKIDGCDVYTTGNLTWIAVSQESWYTFKSFETYDDALAYIQQERK